MSEKMLLEIFHDMISSGDRNWQILSWMQVKVSVLGSIANEPEICPEGSQRIKSNSLLNCEVII